MRLFLLTLATMIAFAGNSTLNRMGVGRYGMDPRAFAAIRVVAGVGMLWTLIALRQKATPALRGWGRVIGAVSLATYMIGFSLAYLSLDAGIGALILFGGVQITMFAGAVINGAKIPVRRWLGSAISLAGLALLLWPKGAARIDSTGAAFMAIAALGWGVYSLRGRQEPDALSGTAANFLLCLPLVAAAPLIWGGATTAPGITLALLAGAVTSGLGYALWYRILPHLDASLAAVAQLSVPLIAVAMGVAMLGETVTPRLLAAAALVLGGIGLSAIRPWWPIRPSGTAGRSDRPL